MCDRSDADRRGEGDGASGRTQRMARAVSGARPRRRNAWRRSSATRTIVATPVWRVLSSTSSGGQVVVDLDRSVNQAPNRPAKNMSSDANQTTTPTPSVDGAVGGDAVPAGGGAGRRGRLGSHRHAVVVAEPGPTVLRSTPLTSGWRSGGTLGRSGRPERARPGRRLAARPGVAAAGRAHGRPVRGRGAPPGRAGPDLVARPQRGDGGRARRRRRRHPVGHRPVRGRSAVGPHGAARRCWAWPCRCSSCCRHP